MIISPIIPIWIMGIICIILIIVLKSKNKYNLIRQIMIIVLLFVINLRIMYISDKAKVKNNNLNVDVFCVIDTTASMVAEDYGKDRPRLEGVKENCNYMIDKLEGGRFSIITFANESSIQIPITKDANVAKEKINLLEGIYQRNAEGSALDIPLEDLKNRLINSYERDKSRNRIVFYISDGEITKEDAKTKSFEECKKYIKNGAVLGYGTKEGAKMRTTDYVGKEEYVKYYDERFNLVDGISKINEDNLKQIAKDMEIDYIKINKKKDIDEKIEEIINESSQDINDEEKSLYTDVYFIFVIPLIILLIYQYIYYRRNL